MLSGAVLFTAGLSALVCAFAFVLLLACWHDTHRREAARAWRRQGPLPITGAWALALLLFSVVGVLSAAAFVLGVAIRVFLDTGP